MNGGDITLQKKLIQRASFIKKIRDFFYKRGVLEVETPQLSHAIGTDPHLHYFTSEFSLPGGTSKQLLYLQTSPEFAMKRLLAAGSGSIFQICKAYRNGEVGRNHNPEFTILEWYRVGFTHHDLMDEMDDLLKHVIASNTASRMSYQSLFETHFDFNPHNITLSQLFEKTKNLNLDKNLTANFDKDTCLHYLLSTYIEPQLGLDAPLFVYDYPSSQAALARLRSCENYHVAERFEVYIKGVELANGFHELNDANEQLRRFNHDLNFRKTQGYPIPKIDQRFLDALPSLPNCAGVALGIDRLIMLATQNTCIDDVIAFPYQKA